jgi:hypothetical protein
MKVISLNNVEKKKVNMEGAVAPGNNYRWEVRTEYRFILSGFLR